MWLNGQEKRKPRGATEVYACRGSYRGEYGAWMKVMKAGKCVGITFRAGYLQKTLTSGKKLQVIRDIEPYVDIAMPGKKVIGSRRDRREFIKRHDLVEVGNEGTRPHPRDLTDARRSRPDPAIVESLKRNSGGKWL